MIPDPGSIELLHEGLPMIPVGPDSGWDWEQGAWNWVGLSAGLKVQALLCMCNADPPFRVRGSLWRAMLHLCVLSLEFGDAVLLCICENIAAWLVWSNKMLWYVCVLWL